ncbi:ankyrin repeat domain protein [Nitzschia inconspicua]|uniref:Ankyrin repeat domain protein n=1 Tax=Nitzschia inconspicua TaxID=303405 RepID=A0A9K3KTJ5_9STRA|nr:ankyrin repeat domain protein [Nitzschia inconspicua]
MDAYVEYSSEGEQWGDDDDDVEPDSILLGLVQTYEWNGTLERIASHPDECKAVGVQGRTPLHVACDHDAPAEVVAALVQAFPEASLMVGTSSMNPLHITCSSHHASVEVVQVLLQGGVDTQTSMRDIDGDTPLHAACRCGAPMETLRVLLEANPAVVHERDYEGLTPLLRLWVRCFVMLGDDVLDRFQGPSDLTGELGETWQKTELLLRCSHLGSLRGPTSPPSFPLSCQNGTVTSGLPFEDLPPNYTFRPVHAVAAVDCPRPVIKMATILYPKQLVELDEMGMTPLLIASKAPIYKVRDLSDEGFMLEDRVYGDSDTDSDHDMDDADRVDSGQPSVLDILVTADPSAARIEGRFGSCRGRLPLHLAVATGKPWNEGIKSILAAYPEAISRIDPLTGLYPFQQAAASDRPECSVIFELLKKDPSLAILSPSNGPSRHSLAFLDDKVTDVPMTMTYEESQQRVI